MNVDEEHLTCFKESIQLKMKMLAAEKLSTQGKVFHVCRRSGPSIFTKYQGGAPLFAFACNGPGYVYFFKRIFGGFRNVKHKYSSAFELG